MTFVFLPLAHYGLQRKPTTAARAPMTTKIGADVTLPSRNVPTATDDTAVAATAAAAAFVMDPRCAFDMEVYMQRRGWLAPDEHVLSVGSAGEGNMNLYVFSILTLAINVSSNATMCVVGCAERCG